MNKNILKSLYIASLFIGLCTIFNLSAQDIAKTRQAQRITSNHYTQGYVVNKQPERISGLLSTPTLSAVEVPGSNTVLGGTLAYSPKWLEQDSEGNYTYPVNSGIYSIQAKPDGTFTKIHLNNDFQQVCAAVKINNTYYAISMNPSDYTAHISEYSTSTWYRSRYEEISLNNVPSDLAYNKKTGKVYGAFYNYDTQEYDRFCSFSTSLGEPTDIGDLERNTFAMAFDEGGTLYAIWGYTGWLVTIDTSTGKYTQIGKTGIYPGETYNSLTFGEDGVLYWTCQDDTGNSALYSIDTTSGVATKIYDYPNNECFVGLFPLPTQTPDDAPDAVTDIKVNYTSDFALTGTISFTAPTKTAAGSTLSEQILAIITVNGKDVATINNITPGSTVTSENITFDAGLQEIIVTPATYSVRGNSTTITSWAGEDYPGPVTNLSATYSDTNAEITWSAPTVGAHGGKINSANLTYKVVRTTDNKVIAESITETNCTDEIAATSPTYYSYAVTASTTVGESTPESVKVLAGAGFTIPFSEDFATQEDFNMWTVSDLNGGSTWTYNDNSAYYKYNNENIAGNDWLFSPKLPLKAGTQYEITFDAKTFNSTNYYEDFAIAIGTEAKPEAMNTLQEYSKYNSKEYQKERVLVSVEADGYYHIGLHEKSDGKKGWSLNIDNIYMGEISNAVPAKPEATVTPGENGRAEAKLEITAPTADISGNTLPDGSLEIIIYRNDKTDAIFSSKSVSSGETISYTDTDFSKAGTYTYRILAQNSAGQGPEYTKSVFIGEDTPGSVTMKSIGYSGKSVILSWEKPTKGAHDGFLDENAVFTYRIIRNDGEVLAENYTETTYTDTPPTPNGKQELYYYVIVPYANAVKGIAYQTDYILAGEAYQAPVCESFANADMTYYPWVVYNGLGWSLNTFGYNPNTYDHTGDNGLATLSSPTATSEASVFSSPKINLQDMTQPQLSFAMYHNNKEGITESVGLTISAGSLSNRTELTFIPLNNGKNGWIRHTVDLSQFKEKESICIFFEGQTDTTANIHIDDIEITEARSTDLSVIAISGPAKIANGETATYIATVANIGSTDITEATLYINGETQTVSNLKANEERRIETSITFKEKGTTTITATTTCNNDAVAANNSKAITVSVVEPIIPAPTNASAIDDGKGVTLTWDSPFAHGCVTDDIEKYTDWAISGIGDWGTIDFDHDNTYRINKDLEEYPNECAPKAFQVCNAKTLGINIWDEGTPHSGNKMLMAMANINTPNNDWLISPMLNGSEQTISFYAKSFTLQDTPAERIRVLYSTTDNNPDNFTQIHTADYIELPDSWLEYRYVVPQGTRYFAINCVSENAFALFVDDLTFNDMTVPNLVIEKYEIYRNGQLIGTSTEPTFYDATDPTTINGCKYTIRAIYNKTVSGDCTTTFSLGGINTTSNENMNIISGEGYINIIGAQGLYASIITPDGKTIMKEKTTSHEHKITLNPGIYLVRISNKTFKVAVW